MTGEQGRITITTCSRCAAMRVGFSLCPYCGQDSGAKSEYVPASAPDLAAIRERHKLSPQTPKCDCDVHVLLDYIDSRPVDLSQFEDLLPEDMPAADYDKWYAASQIVGGVRMGPKYPFESRPIAETTLRDQLWRQAKEAEPEHYVDEYSRLLNVHGLNAPAESQPTGETGAGELTGCLHGNCTECFRERMADSRDGGDEEWDGFDSRPHGPEKLSQHGRDVDGFPQQVETKE